MKGRVIHFNIITMKQTDLFTGTDYQSSMQTIWAKGKVLYAFKFSEDTILVLNSNFSQKSRIKIEDRILHVLLLNSNSFLILGKKKVHLLDGNFLKKESIELIGEYQEILSGAVLDKFHFFVHVKIDGNCNQSRVYNLKGQLIFSRESGLLKM